MWALILYNFVARSERDETVFKGLWPPIFCAPQQMRAMRKIARQAYSYMATSIIAVHGLQDHAITTLLHPVSDMMWLQTLLSVAMPMSRIMSYGYDAKIYKGRSTLHMMDNAGDILSEIQTKRTAQTVISVGSACKILG